jgi:hypothetical protein
MSSDYISRLRSELVGAAEREQARGGLASRLPAPRRILVPALGIAALAAVLVAVGLSALQLGPSEPAVTQPGELRVSYRVVSGEPAAIAETIQRRLAAAGVGGVTVTTDAGAIVIDADDGRARSAIAALTVPGQFAIYDWETSNLRPDGPDDPTSPPATLWHYDAVLLAGDSPNAGKAGDDPRFYLVDDKRKRVLRGPANTQAELGTGGRVLVTRPELRIVQAEGRSDAYHVLAGEPALTGDDVRKAEATVDPVMDEPIVALEFTRAGQEKFSELTRTIARRGADLAGTAPVEETWQHMALVLDDRVLATPFINWRETPDGIDGSIGGAIAGRLTRTDAERIAAILNTGPLPGVLARG